MSQVVAIPVRNTVGPCQKNQLFSWDLGPLKQTIANCVKSHQKIQTVNSRNGLSTRLESKDRYTQKLNSNNGIVSMFENMDNDISRPQEIQGNNTDCVKSICPAAFSQ